MTAGDLFGRLNREQQTLRFKIIASIVLTAVAIFVAGYYAVSVKADRAAMEAEAAAAYPEAPAATNEGQTAPPTSASGATGATPEADPALAQLRAAEELTTRAMEQILQRSADPTAVSAACAVGLGIGLLIIWMGLGLTYLGLLLVTAMVVAPLIIWGDVTLPGAKNTGDARRLDDVGKFLGGVVALTASFTALMQGLRLLLSGNGPVIAIARNVVNEAVRMKVSLVFIVMLVFVLAALPGLLNESTPLRYRVQSFLQYGTGGAFWIIAVLVLFLSVGTVAFEQRDRVIWQTMTKPVAAWQYILGKWLGVVGVAAVLLAVASSGVFLFTEYLRNQPALDEVRPFVARSTGVGGSSLTEDRFILESQVLAARQVIRPDLPEFTPEDEEIAYRRRLENEQRSDLNVQDTPETRRRILDEITVELLGAHLTMEPGRHQRYVFSGLSDARQRGRLLSLRYRIRAGGDDPRDFYRLTFGIEGDQPIVREAPLDQTLTLPISPGAIMPDGTLTLYVLNGDMYRGTANPKTIAFPPDGLELYYIAGSYRANFLRVALLLWTKLAFLAMVGVVAATFLSFPVASLVAFGVFLMAEASAFLSGSLEYFGGEWGDRDFELWRFAIRCIAEPITWLFQFYSKFKPTASLVDGRLINWFGVAQTVAVMGLLIALLYAVGVVIFRRRELATYSGQ